MLNFFPYFLYLSPFVSISLYQRCGSRVGRLAEGLAYFLLFKTVRFGKLEEQLVLIRREKKRGEKNNRNNAVVMQMVLCEYLGSLFIPTGSPFCCFLVLREVFVTLALDSALHTLP